MKFNNKNLFIFTIVVLTALYISVNFVPNVVLQNINGTLQGNNIEKYSRVASNELDIKGMDIITRSDKLYYTPEGAIPTNKVWSSAVFKGEITGLYTYPLASNTKEGTLNITVPKKYVYPKIITAQLISEYLSIKGDDDVDKVNVTSYSDLSVTMSFLNKFGADIFAATFIQGSPYVFIKPAQDTLNLSSAFYKISKNEGGWVYNYDDKNLGVFTNGNAEQSDNNLIVNFSDPSSGYLTIAALDPIYYQQIRSLAGNIINNVTASYQSVNDKVRVTYQFDFADPAKNSTIFGLLPHQYILNGFDLSNALFKMNTLRGDEYFVNLTDTLTYAIERIPLVESLKDELMTEDEKAYMSVLIDQDLRDIVYVRSSTYFGGNDILKLANLLDLSYQIGNLNLETRIKDRLNQEFDEWFNFKAGKTSKYFAYDEAWGGVIGYETTGFGGENYNDHHFQYGYFIHAAAILGKYDPDFVTKYGSFINNLVLDIANTDKTNSNYPYLRYFDQYEGHSWATGLGDFSDGNNQESSSEAINAWYSLWLWGKVTSNTDLQNTADYLYSAEINATRNYWLNWYNNTTIFPADYTKAKAGVVWGGKVEYQTFFSMDPQSIEGIQYLPITPGSIYLYSPDVITRDYSTFKNSLVDTNANLVDFSYAYYAMYYGFNVFPKKFIEEIKIDQGNSRANLYYWTKFWSNVRVVEIINQNTIPMYKIAFQDGQQTVLQ